MKTNLLARTVALLEMNYSEPMVECLLWASRDSKQGIKKIKQAIKQGKEIIEKSNLKTI